jgi:hypothetical protein
MSSGTSTLAESCCVAGDTNLVPVFHPAKLFELLDAFEIAQRQRKEVHQGSRAFSQGLFSWCNEELLSHSLSRAGRLKSQGQQRTKKTVVAGLGPNA